MNTHVEEARADRYTRLAGCLERARGGDREALREVVVELNPTLWHVARAAGLPPDEAEDVVQATWLALLRHLDGIRSPQSLTGWLVSTTRHGAWRARRRLLGKATGDPDALVELEDPAPGPVEQVLTDQRDRILLRHFAKLPERCRRLLRIVATVHRPDYTEVGEALLMPRGSIGPTRGRCLNKLRDLLLADAAWDPTWTN
ncbi:RNA polymerase sigma factor [Dactylosporangium sp. NPDC000521]|uniref:RNA polymerase sigma factor n=1 Tax=Dactylosporangium sp. NPDC000521 TaxID=3363975 RepID=UPI0036A43E25